MDPARIASRPLWKSPRFSLMNETFTTRDGVVERPVIHHPGAVALLAQPDPHSVVLVRQFRYPIRRWTLELPAGTREHGELPEVTARRELAEEAGFACDSLHELLRFFPAVGVSDEEMILYRATGLRDTVANPDVGELVNRAVVPLTDLPRLHREGLILDAKTIIACSLLGHSVLPGTP